MADAPLAGSVKRIKPEVITYDFDADGEFTACATLLLSVTQFSTPNAL